MIRTALLATTTLAVAALSVTAAAAAPSAPAVDSAATHAMFERLIDTPTVLGRGKVPEMATYLAGEFRRAGWTDADIQVLPYTTTNKDGTQKDQTAALIVRWPAAKASGRKPIMLMGHMDVVEARREDSTTDPFALTERDGYYYGRGTFDMKAGLVGIARALIELRTAGFAPRRDIVVFFSGDEETNGIGADKGAQEWLGLMGNPEFGLNADGGGVYLSLDDKPVAALMQTAEKTFAGYTFTVRNRGGHSSKPRPDNAIYSLAHAVERLEAYRFQPMQSETTRAYFAARARTASPALAAAIGRWLADPNDGAAADAIEASETEVGLTRTRCVPTRLFAGHADNALPQLATAMINCRIFPGIAPDAVQAELSRIAADPTVVVTRNDDYGASLSSPLRPDVSAAFAHAVQEIHNGFPAITPEMTTGASDARPFRVAGVPVYGVSGVWIRVPTDLRAHGKDERIPVAALDDNVRHWKMLVQDLTGK